MNDDNMTFVLFGCILLLLWVVIELIDYLQYQHSYLVGLHSNAVAIIRRAEAYEESRHAAQAADMGADSKSSAE